MKHFTLFGRCMAVSALLLSAAGAFAAADATTTATPKAEKTPAPAAPAAEAPAPVPAPAQPAKAGKPRIAVFDFTTIDIQGQHFRDFTDRTVEVAPQNSLNATELGTIDDVMLGYVKMIDAEEERTRRAHDRRRLDNENDRNLARQYELADRILKSPQRTVVIGSAYMEAALGNYDSVEVIDRDEIRKAYFDMAARQAGGAPPLPDTMRKTGATHILYGTVADFHAESREFTGYGVNTKATIYSLDVVVKVVELASGKVVFAGSFTGSDREFDSGDLKIVDPGRFAKLMKSAVAQAAQAIDKKFDPKEENK